MTSTCQMDKEALEGRSEKGITGRRCGVDGALVMGREGCRT